MEITTENRFSLDNTDFHRYTHISDTTSPVLIVTKTSFNIVDPGCIAHITG